MSTHSTSSAAAEITLLTDLEYAVAGGTSLTLDLRLPAGADRPLPVLLYLHGGGWALGDKADNAEARLTPIAARGFAVASANYRLSGQAPFPAQLHDVKAAVRWLRAHADEHGLDANRIAAAGASAGGHLASLLGLTAGDSALEGEVGEHLDQRSDAAAVVAYFPTSDLRLSGARSPLEAQILPPAFPAALLGVGTVAEDLEGARRASPRWHAHAGAPPHLILHGDHDAMVPVDQSRLLHDALSGHGAPSTFLLLAGAGHEDPAFDRPSVTAAVAGFLEEHLAQVPAGA